MSMNPERLRRRDYDEMDGPKETFSERQFYQTMQNRYRHEVTIQNLKNNVRNATGDSLERLLEADLLKADLLNNQLLKAKQETARIQERLRTALSLIDTHQSHARSDWGDSFTSDEALLTLQRDWSGRGSHVEFEQDRALPFQKGPVLGYGLHGPVIQIVHKGTEMALKTIYQRRPLEKSKMSEIEVLKRLSHRHIVKLMGTYFQKPYLGVLIWPVASFDLAWLLDSFETEKTTESGKTDAVQKLNTPDVSPPVPDKLRSGVVAAPAGDERAANSIFLRHRQNFEVALETRLWRLRRLFGCLTSALAYLHGQNVRHKDIKPSNILLSPDGMWLTDFGTAKDFTDENTSSSESVERGTLKYCAPEVAQWSVSGRSADVFSLGCVFLELLVTLRLDRRLQQLANLRPLKNKSYEANLVSREQWLDLVRSNVTPTQDLALITDQMLHPDRDKRPTARNLLLRLATLDEANEGGLHCVECSRWFDDDPVWGHQNAVKLEKACQSLENVHQLVARELRDALPSGDSDNA